MDLAFLAKNYIGSWLKCFSLWILFKKCLIVQLALSLCRAVWIFALVSTKPPFSSHWDAWSKNHFSQQDQEHVCSANNWSYAAYLWLEELIFTLIECFPLFCCIVRTHWTAWSEKVALTLSTTNSDIFDFIHWLSWFDHYEVSLRHINQNDI